MALVARKKSGPPGGGLPGVFRDICERKRTEKALKQSMSLLRTTLESTADDIWVVTEPGWSPTTPNRC